MKYQDAVEQYFKNINCENYSVSEIKRKKSILKKWFSYALALFVPEAIKIIKNIDVPSFYYQGNLYTASIKYKANKVKNLINKLKENPKHKYWNLITFLNINQYEYIKTSTDKLRNKKLNTAANFYRGIGFMIKIENITQRPYNDSIKYLKKIKEERAEGIIRAFLIFCYENKWLGFNPYPEKKSIYARCFEEDFLGYKDGLWKQHFLKYIDYLKYERNLGDGGIDCKVKKLKILIKYLDFNKISRVKLRDLKNFIKIKASDGVKNVTLADYVYKAKYFFNFLIKKGWLKNNPALEIKIKDKIYKEGDVLNETEVNKVLEIFEDEIYKTKNAKRVNNMKLYFRAVRDKLIFQVFVFTGIRLSEAGNIKLNDIDYEKKSIQITGKGNRNVRQKEREISIDPYLWSTFNDYLKTRYYPSQKYLFINWEGGALSNFGIYDMIKRRIKEAGINKNISPHRLRATCSSLYIKKGIDPLTLKTIMGHSTITTTIDKYVKLTDEEVRKIWKETNPLKGVCDEE